MTTLKGARIGSRYRSNSGVGRFAAYSLLVLVAVLTLLPLSYAFFGSFKTLDELLTSGAKLLPTEWTWSNYAEAWVEGGFARYFLNSALVALLVVVYDTFASSACGYVLARLNFRGKRALEVIMASTIFVGLGTATLYPRFVVANTLGIDNLAGIAFVQLSGIMIVHAFLIRSFAQSLGTEIEEAAKLDGCGPVRAFFFVVFPLMRPMVATTMVLAFQASWTNFQIPLVFTLARPALRTLPIGVYGLKGLAGEGVARYDLMMAGSMITLLPVIVIFIIAQRYFMAGLTSGASKG